MLPCPTNSSYPHGHLVRVLGPLNDLKAETDGVLAASGVEWQPFSVGALRELPPIASSAEYRWAYIVTAAAHAAAAAATGCGGALPVSTGRSGTDPRLTVPHAASGPLEQACLVNSPLRPGPGHLICSLYCIWPS